MALHTACGTGGVARSAVLAGLLLLALAVPGKAGAAPLDEVSGVETSAAPEGMAQTRVSAPRSAGAGAAGESGQGRASAPADGVLDAIQMNLCNGGAAPCYSGGLAIPEAVEVIQWQTPDIVTVNEICLGDADGPLLDAMATAWSADWTYYVFMPAWNRDADAPYLCTNGDQYGNAVLGHVADVRWLGMSAWGGIYGAQDGGNEQRSFACAYVIGDHFACATHLSASSEPVALEQCRALLFVEVPYIQSVEGATLPTVVGGDLNLEYDPSDPENAQNCVPNGYTRKGDSDVQHIIFSNDLPFLSTFRISMYQTDHDAFGVRLEAPWM